MDDRRMELDSVLECPKCKGRPYRVYRRQNAQADGQLLETFESVLWPASPDVPPPTNPSRIVCRNCAEELRRVAG